MFLSASDFLRLRSLGHADTVDSCQVRQTRIPVSAMCCLTQASLPVNCQCHKQTLGRLRTYELCLNPMTADQIVSRAELRYLW